MVVFSQMAQKKDDLAIELIDINKSFGNVRANKEVNLSVKKGKIHGIVGENGAGKSTLMSILYGFYHADSGIIKVNGKQVKINDSAAAISLGIGMVHQHFMLVGRFTVLENIMLGSEAGFFLKKGQEKTIKELIRLEKEYELQVDINSKIQDLPVGLQQRVEILKTLYKKANILILDEPTAVLTPQETKHLFRILKELRDQGKTIIIITHKLQEVMEITDEVSVMRLGEVVEEVATKDTNESHLVELMVGRKVERQIPLNISNIGNTLMDVRDLNVMGLNKQLAIKDVSFELREGEIVGIAGVSGNGQTELLEAITGIVPIESGRVIIKNHYHLTPENRIMPKKMRQIGVAHIPEDRFKRAIIRDFSAADTAILGYHRDPKFCNKSIMQTTAIKKFTKKLMRKYDVRPTNPNLKSSSFSGGNQQKLVIGREIDHNPDILIVGQPTRGVDIGAIEFIHQKLISLIDQGKSILLVSTELEEVLALSDRILVMFEGRIVSELSRQEATEKKVGKMMAGINPFKEKMRRAS